MRVILLAGAALGGLYALNVLGVMPKHGPADPLFEKRLACQLAIKSAALDPSSVEWIDRNTWPVEADKVTATWRGRNGFGGMTHNVTVCTLTAAGKYSAAVITDGAGS